jgi:hypothetical protein
MRCKSLRKNGKGRQCVKEAIINGYCLQHFASLKHKLNKKKGLKKEKTCV